MVGVERQTELWKLMTRSDIGLKSDYSLAQNCCEIKIYLTNITKVSFKLEIYNKFFWKNVKFHVFKKPVYKLPCYIRHYECVYEC